MYPVFIVLHAILYQMAAMPAKSTLQPRIVSLFDKHPCWMIEPLASELGYSVCSTRRFLTETGYYSSFTHNGKWYTLNSIPRFGRDGLWFFEDIGFSRAGSLTNTLISLTVHSPAGMTAEQLGEKLRCRCHSVLVQLWRQGKLQREKLGGRSHVYLAVDSTTQALQRQAMTGQDSPTPKMPAEIAVFVLAEFIRQPGLSFEQLAKAVGHRCRIAIKATQIEALFALHDLKKTPPIATPKP